MKLYNKEFAEINYGREVTNGIFVSGRFLYENRRALFNNTDYNLDEEADESVRNMYERFSDITNIFSEGLKGDKLPLFIEWLKEDYRKNLEKELKELNEK